MGIDLNHATIGQLNAASDNSTMNVFNTEKAVDKFLEFNKAVQNVEETIEEIPEDKKETIKSEIETLKGEIVKTEPNKNIIRTSLSVIDEITSTISNAPKAIQTIGGLIMIVKTFLGL